MPCEAGGIGTNVPGLFKAKAGNLLLKVANLEVDRFTQTANLSTLEPNYPQRTQA